MVTSGELRAALVTAESLAARLSTLDAPLLAAYAAHPFTGGLVAVDTATAVARIVALLDVAQAAIGRLVERIGERLARSQEFDEELRVFELEHNEWLVADGQWQALTSVAAVVGITDVGPAPVPPDPPAAPFWYESE